MLVLEIDLKAHQLDVDTLFETHKSHKLTGAANECCWYDRISDIRIS